MHILSQTQMLSWTECNCRDDSFKPVSWTSSWLSSSFWTECL